MPTGTTRDRRVRAGEAVYQQSHEIGQVEH